MSQASPVSETRERGNLWTFSGRIGRVEFAAWTLILLSTKMLLDAWLANALLSLPWHATDYLFPLRHAELFFDSEQRSKLLLLVVVSLPFAWAGVALAMGRLRDAGLPAGLVCLLLVPWLNLGVLVVLLFLPPGRVAAGTRQLRCWPTGFWSSGVLAVCLTSTGAMLLVSLSVDYFESYGWAVFVALPFTMGLGGSVLYGTGRPRPIKDHLSLGCATCLVTAALLIIFAIEGVICLIMAAPIWLPLVMLGSLTGAAIANSTDRRQPLNIVLLLVFSLPFMIGLEAAFPRPNRLTEVRTRVVVAADPATVWGVVTAFPPLDPPSGYLFRSGIAYPISARIEGEGVGAVRYCEFSTGAFVEPITTWDEPRVLAFDVVDQPAVMNEWSVYRHLEPPHLHGFLISERGRFDLKPLGDGSTELSGTTWYRQRLWPDTYWRWWTDFIVSRIHQRVLDHVKAESERIDSQEGLGAE